jgi:hypothetical protein
LRKGPLVETRLLSPGVPRTQQVVGSRPRREEGTPLGELHDSPNGCLISGRCALSRGTSPLASNSIVMIKVWQVGQVGRRIEDGQATCVRRPSGSWIMVTDTSSGGGFTKEALPAAPGSDSLRPRPCPWTCSGRLQPLVPFERSVWRLTATGCGSNGRVRQNFPLFLLLQNCLDHRRASRKKTIISSAQIRAQRGRWTAGPWPLDKVGGKMELHVAWGGGFVAAEHYWPENEQPIFGRAQNPTR